MALGDPYISLPEFKTYMGIDDPDDDVRADTAIRSATEAIEDYCGRQFNDSGSVSTRRFYSNSRTRAVIDDFSTVTGLVVKVGSLSGGYTTTWTIDADFFISPINSTRNERAESVYWRIETLSGQLFPMRLRRDPNVEVAARWGWPAIPEKVVEACYIESARLFRRKDSPDGVIGGFDGAPMRVGWRLDPDVERMLLKLRKHQTGKF